MPDLTPPRPPPGSLARVVWVVRALCVLGVLTLLVWTVPLWRRRAAAR